jgi:hypothetical protein
MRRARAWLAIAIAGLVTVATWTARGAEAQAGCRFVLGFAQVRDLVGAATVGGCLEDERFDPASGDALQRTSGGLLVWREADNWTAFTDGHRTWVNGPLGLQRRLNSERFDWERGQAVATGLPEVVASGARAAAAQQLSVAPDGLVVARAEPVDWPDTSLGCPEPGRVYAQVITRGYRIFVRAGAQTVEVHADEAGRAVTCG